VTYSRRAIKHLYKRIEGFEDFLSVVKIVKRDSSVKHISESIFAKIDSYKERDLLWAYVCEAADFDEWRGNLLPTFMRRMCEGVDVERSDLGWAIWEKDSMTTKTPQAIAEMRYKFIAQDFSNIPVHYIDLVKFVFAHIKCDKVAGSLVDQVYTSFLVALEQKEVAEKEEKEYEDTHDEPPEQDIIEEFEEKYHYAVYRNIWRLFHCVEKENFYSCLYTRFKLRNCTS
jgi:hypothetical protein